MVLFACVNAGTLKITEEDDVKRLIGMGLKAGLLLVMEGLIRLKPPERVDRRVDDGDESTRRFLQRVANEMELERLRREGKV